MLESFIFQRNPGRAQESWVPDQPWSRRLWALDAVLEEGWWILSRYVQIFKTSFSPLVANLWLFFSPFYLSCLDVGTSQLIIDGKIKFKHGSIRNFSKDGLELEDGSSLKADVIVFATG